MKSLLVYIDVNDGNVKRSSLEVLSRCVELAGEHGLKAEALVVSPNASDVIDQIKPYGASRIYTIENPIFKNHLNAPLLKALSTAVDHIQPRLLAFSSTESSKDILGALAANLQAPALPDVSVFDLSDTGVRGKRPVMAAKIMSTVEAEGDTILISVRSGSYDLIEHATNPEVSTIDFSFPEEDIKPVLKEILSSSDGQIDLSEAETIVAAGRGVKDEEGRKLISELASLLHAGIGASRALTESGVYDPSLQIGQTGKVVSPQLYIAVGISGAIQHVAGMANSKVIVAINKDPDAPIFDIADYGIVGDLYNVLPPFIEEIRAIKGS